MTAPAPPPTDLTAAEQRLAEAYVELLDYINRVSGAVERGSWHYLWEKLPAVRLKAQRLEWSLSDQDGAFKAPTVRAEAVLAAVRHYGYPHYVAARALHPAPRAEGGGA